jgi:putative ABC transport system ATP-binding protein
MLELLNAHKHYEATGDPSPGAFDEGTGVRVHAVEDVTLTVASGEFVALFGPSGSGKTTLLLLAAGLLRADSGTVRFDGSDLAALRKRELLTFRRSKLGFVFQGFNLTAGLSAEENVAIPLLLRGVAHREARRRALQALDDVMLADRRSRTPVELSGGEQQRVAIARALVGEPKLILADEPTGNLDSQTGAGVLELLSALPRERGVAALLVTHDAHVAPYADRVLGMRDGRLIEPDLEAATTWHR